MSKQFLNLVLCCLSILLGGIIYVALRTNTHVSIFIYSLFDIRPVIITSPLFNNHFLKYYFPDFLWAFSLNCGLLSIFNHTTRNIILAGIVAFLCGFSWEILQYIKIISGTGDWIDILLYLSACAIAVTINIIFTGEQNEKD